MNNRRRITGYVTSNAMQKTVVVEISRSYRHPLYKKVIRRTTKIKAHCENNDAHIGDKVKLMETRPLSKLKRFTTVKIIKKSSQ